MKINTALVLCAGYGKRLNPLTLIEPKSLLKINDTTILENCINCIDLLGIKKVLINTFYLEDKIENFIKKKKFNGRWRQDFKYGWGNSKYDEFFK